MSATILGAIGTSEAVGSILFGDAGPVMLGDVVFSGMEVPASIAWGGQQQLVVHKFPGGARVIDAMGRDDAPLSWSGILDGFDRADRAFTLDQMRVSGACYRLSWGTHLYSVVVRAFRAEDVAFQVRYTITCEVLRDETADDASTATPLLGAITDGISQALAIAEVVTDAVALGSAVVTDLTSAQATLQPISAVAAGDANSASVQSAVASVQSAAATVQSTAETSLAAIIGTVTSGDASDILLGTSDATSAQVNLTSAIEQSAAQAAAMMVQGYMGRIVDNLTITDGATTASSTFDLPSPPAQVTGGGVGALLTAAGGNLYDIAASRLGDATQWYRIAQANGLDDPQLQGIHTLKIPDPITAPSDGIPAGSNTVL